MIPNREVEGSFIPEGNEILVIIWGTKPPLYIDQKPVTSDAGIDADGNYYVWLGYWRPFTNAAKTNGLCLPRAEAGTKITYIKWFPDMVDNVYDDPTWVTIGGKSYPTKKAYLDAGLAVDKPIKVDRIKPQLEFEFIDDEE